MRLLVSILLVFVLCSGNAFPLSTQDRKNIHAQIDHLVKMEFGDDKYASEFRNARSMVERAYLQPPTKDVLLFFTIEGFGGGNNYSYFLALFTKSGDGYRLVASSAVGGKAKQIDFGYAKVDGGHFFLRSGEFHDLLIEQEYGVRKIYYKWWFDESKLVSDSVPYKSTNRGWVAVRSRRIER